MEFKIIDSEVTRAGNIEERYVYGAPVKKYHCPECSKATRKVVLEFKYIDSKKETSFMASYPDNGFCLYCFEFHEQGRLLNDFYETDIY